MNIYLPDPRLKQRQREREAAAQAEQDRLDQEQIAREDAARAEAAAAERERVAQGIEKIWPRLRTATIKSAKSSQQALDDHDELLAIYAEANAQDLGLSAHVMTGVMNHLRDVLHGSPFGFLINTRRAGLAEDKDIAKQRRDDEVTKLRDPKPNPHGMPTREGHITDEAFLGPVAALIKSLRQSVPSMPEPRR